MVSGSNGLPALLGRKLGLICCHNNKRQGIVSWAPSFLDTSSAFDSSVAARESLEVGFSLTRNGLWSVVVVVMRNAVQ